MVRVFPGAPLCLLVSAVLLNLVQEDPFKLVILSKGRQPSAVSNANFFFGVDGQLSFMVTDEEGVLRIFDYNPRRASSIGQDSPNLI